MGIVRNVHINDAQQLVDIYNYYVLHTVTTFDDVPLQPNAFEEKITSINAGFPFIVFEQSGEILGYAYAGKWRLKPAYKNTVEITVYLKNGESGKQIGTKLYTELIKQLKAKRIHAVIGGMTLPNAASVRLHENFGFKHVAQFKEVGLKFGKWQDVGFWQLILN